MMLVALVPCHASDDLSGCGVVVAIEITSHNRIVAIGRLEYTGKTLELVTFSVDEEHVVALPHVYTILGKTISSAHVYHVKCQNQYGVTASGTIDFRDLQKPRVTLVSEGGQVTTNISDKGQKLRKKSIPSIDLGV